VKTLLTSQVVSIGMTVEEWIELRTFISMASAQYDATFDTRYLAGKIEDALS
jgi:hypothetical protein